MTISLDRLIEGIIATLRADVIPNITDAYARGQAVGVIDVLNNIAPRVEWSRAPVIETLKEKRALLERLHTSLPDVVQAEQVAIDAESSTERLAQESARLDAILCDAILALGNAGHSTARETEALQMIKSTLHDDLKRQMKATRKPLFAEIASGASKASPIAEGDRP